MDLFYNKYLIFTLVICLILIINKVNISIKYKKAFNLVLLIESFTNSLVFTKKIPLEFSLIIILITIFFLFDIIQKEKSEVLV